ncbi:redoxin domain-containing protein [Serinibacter arcticus]|uniref:redoxin domain-containing protein n=1 Tax=Serinibacter arcticus TaxID=1655435 RepID=UPI0013048217|nr:redoxin domain-containing protein [Serinibacter arcticus]
MVPDLALALPFGQQVTLGELRGTPTLLVFVPLAFSPICTGELRDVADALPSLAPARVLVVSCDSAAALHAWRESEGVGVEVASDFWPHGAVARAFDAFDPARGWPVRRTVLLDGGGEPVWCDTSPGGRPRDVGDAVAAVARLTRG